MSTRPAPRLPSPGDVVDRYQVLGRIAKGGMAEVFLARRTGPGGFDKRVAMKVMHAHLSGEENFVSMFLDEARIASVIEHPNVVRVLDVGLFEGELPWMVMELLSGQTLATVHRSAARPPDTRLAIGILLGVAHGLHAAHEARGADGRLLEVVHRDVSPQNIHVGYDGGVKVVDFGIAAAEGRLTHTDTGEIKGKVSYMAPEQIRYPGERVDRRADLWAFGVVAWELFAGRRLFGEGDAGSRLYQILNEPIAPLATENSEVPAAVAALVDQCLARDPDERPDDAAVLAATLRDAIADSHAWLKDDLAAYMDESFGEVKRRSEALIDSFVALFDDAPSAAARGGSEPASAEVGSRERSGNTTETSPLEGPVRPSPRRWKAWFGMAFAVAAIGVVAFLLRHEVPGAPPEPVSDGRFGDVAAPPAELRPEAAEPTTAMNLELVELRVGANVERVRIAGELREERPLRLHIEPGQHVEVELLGSRGRAVRRRVNVEDHGSELRLPARRSRPTRPGMRSKRLMGSPY